MNSKFKDLIINEGFEDYENFESLPPPALSVRARKRLNRLFREIVGSSKIPCPEVDNHYELTRSKIVRFFKVIIFRISKK